jgi:hypothetical protein
MKMNLKDVYEELTTKDFYGKVTAQTLKDENNYLIRFTSLPPEVTAYFQAHQNMLKWSTVNNHMHMDLSSTDCEDQEKGSER